MAGHKPPKIDVLRVKSSLLSTESEISLPKELAALLKAPLPLGTDKKPAEPAKPAYLSTGKILVLDHVIDEKLRRKLLEFAATETRVRSKINIYDDGDAGTAEVRTNIRDTFYLDVSRINETLLNPFFCELFTRHIEPFYGSQTEWWENPSFLCYEPGGHYGLHTDADWEVANPDGTREWRHMMDRDISVILYLNDDFAGGDLIFPNHDLRIKPKPGMLVAFPSTAEYLHGAEPTTSGERFALVTWITNKGVPKILPPPDPRNIVKMDEVKQKLAAAAAQNAEPASPQRILQLENTIDTGAIYKLLQFAATEERSRTGLVNFADNEIKATTKIEANIRDTFYLRTHPIRASILVPVFNHIVQDIIEPFFGMQAEWWEDPGFLCYEAGGHYAMHNDADIKVKDPDGSVTWKRILDRDYSIILYLNDKFTGGQLYFPKQNLTITPKPGLLVAFPSSHHYEHRAMPVESGERFVLVSWISEQGVAKVRPQPPNYNIVRPNRQPRPKAAPVALAKPASEDFAESMPVRLRPFDPE